MSAHAIASRYAKSLISLAEEMGKVEEVYQDMAGLHALIKESRPFELMLKSPIIHVDKKNQIVEAAFGKDITEITHQFLSIVIRKKRESFLKRIAEQYIRLYNLEKGIKKVSLTTAVTVSENVHQLVADLVKKASKAKDIELTATVDKEIMGGFILRYDDKLYDASVASSLDELQNEFKKNTYIKKF